MKKMESSASTFKLCELKLFNLSKIVSYPYVVHRKNTRTYLITMCNLRYIAYGELNIVPCTTCAQYILLNYNIVMARGLIPTSNLTMPEHLSHSKANLLKSEKRQLSSKTEKVIFF